MRPAQVASGAVGLAAGAVASAATGAAGWLAGTRPHRREVWARPGRLHIETHGVHGPAGTRVARRVERALEDHPLVLWARVNAPTRRVVVAVDHPPPSQRELVDLVAEAEAASAADREEAVERTLHHPSEGPGQTGLPPHLVVDTLALLLAGGARLAPWAPLPAELAGLISAAELHPRVRGLAAGRLHGAERADSAISMITRLSQAVSARSSGTVLDIAQRVGQWREARASQAAWRAAEPRLIQGPDDAGAPPVASERPVALPDGPAERHQRRAAVAAAGAVAAATPMVGLRRATAIGLAALPKATSSGPDAFASHLGRVLSRAGALVMDRTVLRRLNRVDVLLLDEAAVRSREWSLTDLIPLPGADPAEVAELGFALFDQAQPEAVQRADGWTLGPLAVLPLPARSGDQAASRLAAAGAELVLGLARGNQLAAVLAAEPEPLPGLDNLVAAARQTGLRVFLASPDTEPDPEPEPEPEPDSAGSPDGRSNPAGRSQPGRVGPAHRNGYADDLVPGSDLLRTVQDLQLRGGTVMLLSAQRQALGAADCGIGVHIEGEPPPWGAQVIVGEDLAAAGLLVEAVAAARRVDRESIMLAKLAGGIGAVSALADANPRPAGRSLGAVNTGATLAFAAGVWRARQLRARPPAPVRARPPWHLMPPAAVLRRLGTSRAGLGQVEAERRSQAGVPAGSPGTSLGGAFLAELANPLTPVLAGGAALSAVLGSLVDAGLVAGITAGSALTGAVQQVRTDRALADLLARAAVGATVRRDGVEQTVNAERLVPGDIVRLRAGDVVPADCRLIEADAVEADESSLTGESLPVTKSTDPVVATELAERSSMVYEGSTLANGEALAVVVATGSGTEVGRSMAAARQAAPRGGVQAHLSRLTQRSLPLALGSAGAVTAAGLLHRVPVRQSLHSAVSLAVSSVPEGLPFLISAAQLAAARRLADRGALVRNPGTIEALGRVDVLCFDKTGTLTEGKLSVREVHDGHAGQPIDSLDGAGKNILAAALRATPNGRRPEELAHQTDRAVVESARRARVQVGTGARGWQQQVALAFDPSRGFHASLGQAGTDMLLSVKGAPEVVLARCDRRGAGGRFRPLTEADRRELATTAERLAGSGRRLLAVAERRDPAGGGGPLPGGAPEPAEPADEAVDDLVFLGFLALADPVRDSAAPAAAQLRDAGVQIVMVTGDHPATAEAIAATVHPDRDELTVVTGPELEALDDAGLDRRLPEVDVIARCSPAQKVRIIQAYQRLGKVVAMTGDGANDAPAIRLADVGIALGRRGTPAAQAAADLVVSDDRLETIIAALVEGRAMWSSVRHALGILLGGNLGEIAFTVLGAALTGRSPLGARQLLLVNLLTDLAPAVAIALRPPGEDVSQLLREGPDRSLGGALGRETAIRAVATTAGAGSAWLAARLTGRQRRASTVALAALVGSQLGQTLVTGGRDRNVLLAGLGSAAVLVGVVQTPGVSGFFGCTPLGPVGWGIAAGGAAAGTALGVALPHLPLPEFQR